MQLTGWARRARTELWRRVYKGLPTLTPQKFFLEFKQLKST